MCTENCIDALQPICRVTKNYAHTEFVAINRECDPNNIWRFFFVVKLKITLR